MKDILLCRVCGHINQPIKQALGQAAEPARCSNCWSPASFDAVSETQGELLDRRRRVRRRLRFLLNNRWTLLIGLVVAGWTVYSMFDLGPLIVRPSGPTTAFAAYTGADAWSQVRRTPDSAGFTSDPAPFPGSIKCTMSTARELVISPAVFEDTVYLTTEDGRTLALDRETGDQVWEYRSGFPSSSTPAVAGDLVVFGLRPGPLIALNRHSDALEWEIDLNSGILASPIIVDGTVFVAAADSKLYAVDLATGRQRWDFASKDWIISTVAHAGDSIVLTSKDQIVYVVDTNTGRRRFLYDTGRSRRVGRGGPAVYGDMAFFGTKDGKAWGINRLGKTKLYERGILYWRTNFFLWGFASRPPVQKGSGWSKTVGEDLTLTSAVADGVAYFAGREGKVIALNASDGGKLWETEFDTKITGPLTVAGDTVLVGTKAGTIYGLAANNGEVLWQFQTGGTITGSSIVAGGTMYVSSNDGNLYAVTALPGE